MTPRELLKDMVADIGDGPDDGALLEINAEDAAALRELDQLLASVSDCLLNDCERNNNGLKHPKLREIEHKLRQAGY